MRYVDGLCGGLHIIPEGTRLYFDGSYGRIVLDGDVATCHDEALKGTALLQEEAAAAALGQRGTRECGVHLELTSGVEHTAITHHLDDGHQVGWAAQCPCSVCLALYLQGGGVDLISREFICIEVYDQA